MKPINWKQVAVEILRLVLALMAGVEGARLF